jgi:hypothetical protein
MVVGDVVRDMDAVVDGGLAIAVDAGVAVLDLTRHRMPT